MNNDISINGKFTVDFPRKNEILKGSEDTLRKLCGDIYDQGFKDGVNAARKVTIITCDECEYQQKIWHADKRCKNGGYFVYSCDLCGDINADNPVEGQPGQYCSSGKEREV